MKIAAGLLVAVVIVTPMQERKQPGYPGFAILKVADLRQHDQELSHKVGPDHSARETLQEFGDHRIRMLLRDADGAPEMHPNEIDYVIVQSGAGTLMLGGKLTGATTTSGGETSGGMLEGGEVYSLAPGDILHIPAKVPHSFRPLKGQHLTYVLLKIPAVYPTVGARGGR
jgi:mannose-6-phosphate isomerase-like protein (cupin superfamily)